MLNRLDHHRWLIFMLLIFSFSACKSHSDNEVIIQTSVGSFTIKLYDETTKYRKNFLSLVKEEYYDSLLFHRIIPDQIIQGGDPESKNAPPGKFLGTGDVEHTLAPDFRYVHTYGAVAAARKNDEVNPQKRSSGAQFFIVIGEPVTDQKLDQIEKEKGFTYTEEQRKLYKLIGGLPMFDRDYSVFGEVVSGMEVVKKISRSTRDANDRPVDDIPMVITLNSDHDKE